MKSLRLEDESNGVLVLTQSSVGADGEDAISASFELEWDGNTTYCHLVDIGDVGELIKWLERIKENMLKNKSQ